MVNKKGYLRTLESVIAVVIILMFVFYLIPKSNVGEIGTPENVISVQKFILQSIISNETLKNCVIGYTSSGYPTNLGIDCNDYIMILIENNLPPGYDYDVVICDKQLNCVSQKAFELERAVYVDDITVSSSDFEDIKPRILSLYMWRKE